ncbi:MAG: aminotransferase class V-fold PLP-dependent enzyme [Oscillospiraceae bacterium]|jgi:cysteine desulfurase family protein|nr:aminotransferase class V-fold PLP-dependent enzyme [Oscillospiraceae bacterium]MCI8715006.1 aminotransferase class V-fold PLP-dependent enzyme [Oscillospiraceae bacterium]
MRPIYLDNAATSFPKPPAVAQAAARYLTEVGASINRGVYASAQDAGMTTLLLREGLCRLFRHNDPTHCVLTAGNTMGLNMVLRGWLKPGDHCLVSAMEHNAVMRPLQDLAAQGVSFDRIPCDSAGRLDPADIPPLIRPNTRLLVMAHGSNVSGAVQDAAAVGSICRERGIPFALDAAQTAGHWDLDFTGWGLSALSVPGHKGLMGPSGIGALLLGPAFARELTPIVTGGTGSASDSEIQPAYMPDRFESGTPNLPGIYGLQAAVDFILETGVEVLHRREMELTGQFLEGIRDVPGIRLAGPWELENRAGVISVDFLAADNAEAAFRLEQAYGILTRCGLHCAPSAHKTLGTFPQGTVRFSPGWFTTPEEIRAAVDAVREIARE